MLRTATKLTLYIRIIVVVFCICSKTEMKFPFIFRSHNDKEVYHL